MADGGQINLRLSLQGAEQIRAQLATIGPAGSGAMRELDRAMRQPTAGMRALDVAAGEARAGMEGFAGRAGAAGTILTRLGPWGIAAAAGLVAVGAAATAALSQARGAMQLADDIEDAAARVYIGVEALQEWRFAARNAGAEARDADAAIGDFMRRFGEASSGLSPRAMRPFDALGFTPEDLQNFENGEEALAEVIKRISQLGDASEQAAVAERLGLGPLLPLIRQGSEEIARLRDEAQDLGAVMDAELVERAAAAQLEFENLSEVIDVQLKSAFADLGPVIIWLMDLIADFARGVSVAANAFRSLEDQTDDGLRRRDRRIGEWQTQMLEQYGSRENMNGRRVVRFGQPALVDGQGRIITDAGQYFDALQGQRQRISGILGDRADAAPTPPPLGNSELEETGGGGGGADRAAREAQRRAEQIERNNLRVAEELYRDRLRALTASRGESAMLEDLHEVARQRLAMEQQHEREALERQRQRYEETGGTDGLSAEAFAQRQAVLDELHASQQANLASEQRLELAEARRDAEQELLGLQMEMLGLASAGARTQEERREIELRLLEISQARVRAELEALEQAAETIEQREIYQRALAELPRLFEMQRDEVNRNTAGPWERYRNSLPQTPAEMRESLEGLTVDALSDLSRGLVEVWSEVRSVEDAWEAMGQTALNMLGRLTQALYEMALQQMLIEPLGDYLFGDGKGGGGGGSGWMNFAANFFSSMMGGGGRSIGSTGISGANGSGGPSVWNGMGVGPGGFGPGQPGWAGAPDPTWFAASDRKGGPPDVPPAASAWQPPRDPGAGVARFEIVNHGSEKLKGEVTPTAGGGARIDLYPEFKQMLGKAGQDGTLGKAAAASPRTRRRG